MVRMAIEHDGRAVAQCTALIFSKSVCDDMRSPPVTYKVENAQPSFTFNNCRSHTLTRRNSRINDALL